MEAALSKMEREALKAIYRRTAARRATPAHTGDLADDLGVAPGTATSTVKRLADRGLVDHRPYRGVELTAEGREAAVAAIRRHRIVERFLADTLGYRWNEADQFAKAFEHDLPQDVEDRLYLALDRPTRCPHGFPIPGPDGDDIPTLPVLYDLEPGDRATIAVPGSTEPTLVAYLDTLGLQPGVVVEVTEKQPFDGPLVLRLNGQQKTIGEKVARRIHVTRDEPTEPRKEQPA
jgi:DtxR family Mn-dependent transcriptional regulator